MGGIHPTVLPDETLADENVDFVVRGEGEQTMHELVSAMNKNNGFEKILGLSFKKRGSIVHNPSRPFIDNLDALPFPARHLLPMKKYHKLLSTQLDEVFQKPIDSVLGSRGCPYHCIFCAARTVSGHRYRVRSIKNIIREIEALINTYGIRQICFGDDNLVVNKDRTEKLCDELIRRGISDHLVWICETRIDSVDKEILQKMKIAGCKLISFGIESGSQRLLNLIKKETKIETIEKTLNLAKEVGIITRGTFMLGLPTETLEETQRTIEFAIKLDLDFVKFSLTTPYPGTELYNRCLEENSITSFDWTRYSSMAGYSDYDPIYVPLGRKSSELKEWQRKSHRKFYLRPEMIMNHLQKINSLNSFKRYLAVGKVLLGFT
jgi:radical SAM superfamily enzyme YgiQ (UPF0313 family)